MSLIKGLVGHWKLDQESLRSATVLADATPYSNHGTSANAVVFTTDRQGQANRAFVFNGTSDVINMGDVNDVGSGSFTIAVWIEVDAIGATQVIMSKGEGGDNPIYSLYVHSSGKVKSAIEDTGANTVTSTADGTTLVINTWTHIAVVIDRTGDTLTRYINGVADGSVDDISSVTGTLDGAKDFLIGDWDDTSSRLWFGGTIDDARLYNRALSAAEILSVATQYRPQLRGIDKGLVAHYPLDQESLRSTTVFADKTPNSNHGTIVNGVGFVTDRMGQSNRAYDFNGSNTYIDLGASLEETTALTTKTIAVWVKSDLTDLGTDARLVQLARIDAGSGFALMINSSTDRWSLYYRRSSSGTTLESGVSITTAWTHLLGVQNGSSVKIYINGIEIVEATDAAAPAMSSPANAFIGAFNNKGTAIELFNGSLADARIYNRALSDAEITALYTQYRPQIVSGDKGLVASYPLDQESLKSATVFADRTPYSNHGTLTAGTGGFSTDRMGQSNKAYDFDGSADVITISDPDILDFGTGDFSISFWMFSDDLAATKYILQKKVSFNNNSAGFTVFISADNGINARIADGTNVQYLDSDVTVADGEWHSVVLTFDRSANLTVYVDDGVGVSEAIDGAANSISNNDDLWIGQRNGGAAFFNGKLAELKFYNRILSATEITSHATTYRLGLRIGS